MVKDGKLLHHYYGKTGEYYWDFAMINQPVAEVLVTETSYRVLTEDGTVYSNDDMNGKKDIPSLIRLLKEPFFRISDDHAEETMFYKNKKSIAWFRNTPDKNEVCFNT